MMQLALERLPSYEVEPGETLKLRVGDTIKVTVGFEYRGGAASFTLYGALGNRGTLGFGEIVYGENVIELPVSTTWQYFEKTVNIKITDAVDPGFYDIYCKIKEAGDAGRPEQIDVIEVQRTELGWKGVVLIAGLGLAGAMVLSALVRKGKPTGTRKT